MPNTRPRYARINCAIFILLLATLLVSGCQPSKGLSMSRNYSAEDIFTGPQLELARAIESNDMAALRRSAVGVDLHAQGRQQMTLMWFAMMQKNTDAIRTLVELGVHPSDDEMDGMPARTPLGAALMSEDTFYLEAMLDGGLSPNDAKDSDTPLLEKAVISSTLDHVKLLVERGADIDTKSALVGRTAFDLSTSGTKPEVAIYLLEHSSEPNVRTGTGVTTAWRVHLRIQDLQPGPLRNDFIKLRDMMIERGVEFPPPSPVEMREQMRAEGLTPRVPPGHDR
ncbi:ankyrin repeat domain-containing protein [Halomonas chromatireducens]|uniref:Ankyrin repeats (3 copies) n=1 Tax=Halomonas chromatireducens TaxID=507626 RepID=A0A0X8HC00_9GAMM|nr:ankyrin repeat domain-containing protein [Halomonas chromatireducens]AMC99846.1 Ankyrin repeats (3 copies) [Halomonas chromatireducens]